MKFNYVLLNILLGFYWSESLTKLDTAEFFKRLYKMENIGHLSSIK